MIEMQQATIITINSTAMIVFMVLLYYFDCKFEIVI